MFLSTNIWILLFFGSIIRNKHKLLFEEILAVRNFFLSILTYTYTSRSVLAPKKWRTLFLIVKFCMLQKSEFSEQRSNILHRTEHARSNIRINPSLALTPQCCICRHLVIFSQQSTNDPELNSPLTRVHKVPDVGNSCPSNMHLDVLPQIYCFEANITTVYHTHTDTNYNISSLVQHSLFQIFHIKIVKFHEIQNLSHMTHPPSISWFGEKFPE